MVLISSGCNWQLMFLGSFSHLSNVSLIKGNRETNSRPKRAYTLFQVQGQAHYIIKMKNNKESYNDKETWSQFTVKREKEANTNNSTGHASQDRSVHHLFEHATFFAEIMKTLNSEPLTARVYVYAFVILRFCLLRAWLSKQTSELL